MKRKQSGMTFIEVLVALFIIVTGILGAVAMQASAKKGSFDAMQRSLASGLAQDIVERIRNNSNANIALYTAQSPYGSGKIDAEPTCDSAANLCTPAQMVTHDLYGWEQSLMGAGAKSGETNTGGLVGAEGCISAANNAITVVISWQGKDKIRDAKKSEDCGTSGRQRRQIVVEAFVY
ncbi:type IV pilus modification protein PilV [Thalassotalea sp. PLHSN55]|uniref:type IV pilus modification protein PilV n=1 Tax=Thalassotalea sp. PLHSN55 TaxID=3435888 RepID=UPI003F8621D8